MAYAPARPALVRIEVGRDENAAALVRLLSAVFDVEDVSFDATSVEVRAWPRGDSSEALVRVLETVQNWLAAHDLDSTRIHVEGHSYRVTAPLP